MVGDRSARPSVLVAGGGIAALEAVLALQALAAERVAVTLLSPAAELVYRPVTVAEAFGRGQARSFAVDAILAQLSVPRVRDALVAVDPDARTVLTAGGDELRYDRLLIATGARSEAMLPGALTFRGREDVPALQALLTELVEGTARSVAFTLPTAQIWSMPIYELAVLTAAHLREHHSPAQVTIVTPEAAPLELFGPEAERALRPLLAQLQVAVRASARPAGVRYRELVLAGGGSVVADRVVTLPMLLGPGILGIPADDRGFIPVDSHGRVAGVPDVFAAGDVTAFPLKQGGLATQQADAAAATIARDAGAPVDDAPFHPVLRGLLITAGAPIYLRCEPQRLPRQASVAIDQPRPARARTVTASVASDQALWWPPAKIAGRYLGPYLAGAWTMGLAHAVPAGQESLADRTPIPGPAVSPPEFQDAVELALLMADADARWGDYRSALSALDAAADLAGALPPEYEVKRGQWLAELNRG